MLKKFLFFKERLTLRMSGLLLAFKLSSFPEEEKKKRKNLRVYLPKSSFRKLIRFVTDEIHAGFETLKGIKGEKLHVLRDRDSLTNAISSKRYAISHRAARNVHSECKLTTLAPFKSIMVKIPPTCDDSCSYSSDVRVTRLAET